MAKSTKRVVAAKKAVKAEPAERSLEQVVRITEFKMAHEQSIAGLLWLPGDRIVAATDGHLTFWDLASERRVHELPTDSIRDLKMSADGRVAVSGSEEGVVRLWDLVAHCELGILGEHAIGPDEERRYLSAVAMSPDGRVAVSAGYDRMLRIWDVETRSQRHAVTLPDMAFGCAVSPDGTIAAAGGSDDILRFIDIATGQIMRTCEAVEDFITSVSWSPDGAFIATTNAGPQAAIWDAATGALLRKWRVPGPPHECGFLRDSKSLWTTGGQRLATFDVATGTPSGERALGRGRTGRQRPDRARRWRRTDSRWRAGRGGSAGARVHRALRDRI